MADVKLIIIEHIMKMHIDLIEKIKKETNIQHTNILLGHCDLLLRCLKDISISEKSYFIKRRGEFLSNFQLQPNNLEPHQEEL